MKYKITNEVICIEGHVLHRIVALEDFFDVERGDKGGWIESEQNLSQEGDCWIYDNAMVYGNANVLENAMVFGNAMVFRKARVYGNAMVFGEGWVYGRKAEVFESSKIFGRADVCGKVFGNAKVCDRSFVAAAAEVFGNAYVKGKSIVYGGAWVGDCEIVNKVVKMNEKLLVMRSCLNLPHMPKLSVVTD